MAQISLDFYHPAHVLNDRRAVHDRSEEVLARIYIGRRFRNDTERLKIMSELFTKVTKSEGAA